MNLKRARPRPLSYEDVRLLQLLLYEMCRPGQPNPLIRALSHSLYQSLAASLSNGSNSASSNNKSLEGKANDNSANVTHSTSMPCLNKNGVETCDPLQSKTQQHAQPVNVVQQRSVSLSLLQIIDSDQSNRNDCDSQKEERLQQKLVNMLGDGTLSFLKAKEDFKRQIHFNGTLYSDMHPFHITSPYGRTAFSRVCSRIGWQFS